MNMLFGKQDEFIRLVNEEQDIYALKAVLKALYNYNAEMNQRKVHVTYHTRDDVYHETFDAKDFYETAKKFEVWSGK